MRPKFSIPFFHIRHMLRMGGIALADKKGARHASKELK
jgi:hypothetical protein